MPKSKYVVVTPEQRELERKSSELAGLERELAERELELATLRNELRSFEGCYFHTVGSLYAELDDLEAQLAEAKARQHHQERSYRERATQARAKAKDSAQAISAVVDAPAAHFAPSDELKQLYRDWQDRFIQTLHRTTLAEHGEFA